MKTLAIVQARMGSTRLPGKVLAEIAGKPMLARVVERTRRAKTLDQVVVATSSAPVDDRIAELCARSSIACFRGSEGDVLERYYEAAKHFGGEAIVRITADCPLIDPVVIDRVSDAYWSGAYDYVTNTTPRTYPDGLDVEIFSFAALAQAHFHAREPVEREHVTPYLRAHPELFRAGNVRHTEDLGKLRWTVDYEEDMRFVKAVYERMSGVFVMTDVLELLERCPELGAR
jgi:spore coat polysaccharide biosynthesis protein SpsF